MTTWESRDKHVKKEIIREGSFTQKPSELSVCNIYVDKPASVGLSVEQIKNDLYSEIVGEATSRMIVMGEACSKIDRYIERAIQTMSLNEQSLITVQILPDDPALNETVFTMEVTLQSCKFHKPIWKWTAEEKYETAMKYKEKGVDLFKAKRIVDAFHRFSKACKILITLEPLQDRSEPLILKVIELKYILYNNMAECQLMRENYENAITLCCKVLSREESNVKALYRRGVAYGGMKNYEKAVVDLKVVVNLEPNDKRAQEKFNFYTEQWRISVQGYEDIVRKMFKT